MLHIRIHTDKGERLVDPPLAQLEDLHRVAGNNIWVDLDSATQRGAPSRRARLRADGPDGRGFLAGRQRAKLEAFDGYNVLIMHGMSFDPEDCSVETPELDIVLGKNFLITSHERACPRCGAGSAGTGIMPAVSLARAPPWPSTAWWTGWWIPITRCWSAIDDTIEQMEDAGADQAHPRGAAADLRPEALARLPAQGDQPAAGGVQPADCPRGRVHRPGVRASTSGTSTTIWSALSRWSIPTAT